jgi:CBS-domain-containing membrane protein
MWSWIGSFAGIGLLGYLSSSYFEPRDLTMIIGSFGASAVLVYSAIKSPLAQPRNLIGGHILSGLAGVLCYQLFGKVIWAAAALAVSFSIALMLATKTLHPPGGATALIAVIGGDKIHNLGFLYAFVPAGLGAVIILVIALFVNNLAKGRKYPEYWY